MTAQIPLRPIHGSYLPDDCRFLLTPIETEFVSIEEKERRIQSGEAHYSEMIHREPAPSEDYLRMFETLCERYGKRMAGEVRLLARELVADYGHSASPITLVSLVRAGTPAGARRATTSAFPSSATAASIPWRLITCWTKSAWTRNG